MNRTTSLVHVTSDSVFHSSAAVWTPEITTPKAPAMPKNSTLTYENQITRTHIRGMPKQTGTPPGQKCDNFRGKLLHDYWKHMWAGYTLCREVMDYNKSLSLCFCFAFIQSPCVSSNETAGTRVGISLAFDTLLTFAAHSVLFSFNIICPLRSSFLHRIFLIKYAAHTHLATTTGFLADWFK